MVEASGGVGQLELAAGDGGAPEMVLQGEPVVTGGVNGGTPLSQERMARKRKRMEKHIVVTRWACPREVQQKAKGPVVPVTDCSKCGGMGCQLEVFVTTSPAEEVCICENDFCSHVFLKLRRCDPIAKLDTCE